jgi:hypothetical protein
MILVVLMVRPVRAVRRKTNRESLMRSGYFKQHLQRTGRPHGLPAVKACGPRCCWWRWSRRPYLLGSFALSHVTIILFTLIGVLGPQRC